MSLHVVSRIRRLFVHWNGPPTIPIEQLENQEMTAGRYRPHVCSPVLKKIDLFSQISEQPAFAEGGAWWLQTAPSIGLLEFYSIPQGIKCCDQMLKSSPVHLLEAVTVCPGKFLAAVGGNAVTVEYAMEKGRSVGEKWLADSLYIPDVERKVLTALAGFPSAANFDTIGVIETASVATAIIAADVVAKTTDVSILQLRIARELGGKAYFITAGDLGEVEASLEAAEAVALDAGKYLQAIAIPVPDDVLLRKMGLMEFTNAKHVNARR